MNEVIQKVQITDQFDKVNLVWWFAVDGVNVETLRQICTIANSGLFWVNVVLSLHLAQDTKYFDCKELEIDEFGNFCYRVRVWDEDYLRKDGIRGGYVERRHVLPGSSFDRLNHIALKVR